MKRIGWKVMGKSAVQWKFETLESGRTRREPLVQSCSEIPQKKSVCLRSQFILNQGTGLQIKKNWNYRVLQVTVIALYNLQL